MHTQTPHCILQKEFVMMDFQETDNTAFYVKILATWLIYWEIYFHTFFFFCIFKFAIMNRSLLKRKKKDRNKRKTDTQTFLKC